MPSMSCLVVSHNKPSLAHEAINSVIIQDMPDWELVIMDSGVLYDAGYFNQDYIKNDARITVVKSNENDEIKARAAMAPWCWNECFRRGLVHGTFVMYLCDDDCLYPHAFSTFVNYANQNPHVQAMYASQDVGAVWPDGRREIIGERRAIGMGGKCCAGRIMDCQVDYLQFCHRASILNSFPNNEYWPEYKPSGHHADGLFMEKVGLHYPIYPIDIKVSINRRTPLSFYNATK